VLNTKAHIRVSFQTLVLTHKKALELSFVVSSGRSIGYNVALTSKDTDGNGQTKTAALTGTGTFTTAKGIQASTQTV
jgi:hypothetical protein